MTNNRLELHNYGSDSWSDWFVDSLRWTDLDINIEFTSNDYMPLIVMLVAQVESSVAGMPTGGLGSPLKVDLRVLIDGDPQGCIYTASARAESLQGTLATIKPVRLNAGFMTTLTSSPGPHVLSAQVRDRSGMTAIANHAVQYSAVEHSFMRSFGIAR